jgi:copper chaperone CopZ
MNPAPQQPGSVHYPNQGSQGDNEMFRRRFLQMMTIASVGGLAPLEAISVGKTKDVTYLVKGFSCITCATGLDTMLGQQKGIVSSKSIYPEGKVAVRFDAGQITEQAIVTFITDLGFTVQGEHQG